MENLGKLFGGVARVKVMKLFLFNPTEPFDVAQVAERAKISVRAARTELTVLASINFLRSRSFFKNYPRAGKKAVRRRASGWALDTSFNYLKPVQEILLNTDSLRPKEIIKKISKVGKIRLLLITGVFLSGRDGELDLLLVGDDLKLGILEGVIRGLEAEIGKELRYAAFETQDFLYRLNLYDRLVRGVLGENHQKLINKLGL